jgi:hypothetical protein
MQADKYVIVFAICNVYKSSSTIRIIVFWVVTACFGGRPIIRRKMSLPSSGSKNKTRYAQAVGLLYSTLKMEALYSTEGWGFVFWKCGKVQIFGNNYNKSKPDPGGN